MKNVYMQHLTAKIPTQQTCYSSHGLMFSQWRYQQFKPPGMSCHVNQQAVTNYLKKQSLHLQDLLGLSLNHHNYLARDTV
jgi:hypothetical protein